MSDFIARHNRAVWFDIPVSDLIRASSFYSKVLAIQVDIIEEEGLTFSVLEHSEGNGGCLVPGEGEISADKGIMLYLNVDGRIRDAVSKVTANGGKVIQDIHAIGPYGFRAIIHDSEGNRLVLHSETDA